MSALSAEQLQHLIGLLDERYTREMREISSVAARSRDERRQEALAGDAIELLDAALAELALATDYAVVRQDVQDVRDVIGARRRIAAGNYGSCTDCGADIGYERLKAYPTARRCIACQRVYEERKAAREGRPAR